MIYDVIGIGFGPSNLAIAATIEDLNLNSKNNYLFIEKKKEFDWHPGMLIDGARMQISYQKDLATMRSPRSKYTFLNYLHDQGRLEDFINLKEFYPTRYEYRDYLKWAAEQLDCCVNYKEHVVDITPKINGKNEVIYLNIHTINQNGRKTIYRTKNIILSTGLVPKLPVGIGIDAKRNEFHSSQFLPSLNSKFSDRTYPWEFLIVGSGQSAAEIALHLLNEYPNAKINATIRDYAYKPADSSEFVNEMFFYSNIDEFFKLGADEKKRILNKYRDTNYSVVDPPLIRELYQRKYDMSVMGDERFNLVNYQELKTLRYTPNEYHIGIAQLENVNTKEMSEIPYHGVFLSTGYDDQNNVRLATNLSPWMKTNGAGQLLLGSKYQVATSKKCRVGIFMLGSNEHSHGLSDTLLSVLPERALDVVNQLTSQHVCEFNSGVTLPKTIM